MSVRLRLFWPSISVSFAISDRSSCSLFSFFLHCAPDPPHLPSFPTRRSSDLSSLENLAVATYQAALGLDFIKSGNKTVVDRKSTRLNSSHLVISYAVFCLKKKKQKITERDHAW